MSFSYLKNRFKKKKDGKEVSVEDNREIIRLDDPGEEAGGNAPAKKDDEILTQVMTRINEIENDIPRIKISIDTLKSQINELRKEIERLDGVIKDVMVLYEIVSQQINPFKDVDSSNPLMSEIQAMREEIENLKDEIAQIKADLRLLVIDGMDLDELIYEVISGGEP
ncbi:flagella accessory protein C [Thermococcus sp.]|uniref:flagella accessory protein C n=1 Tax=Thermococcus sp. TaxID=35749 RepID=UPI0026059D73|nr:flagella accessory protein C [Thermococcus sp.]